MFNVRREDFHIKVENFDLKQGANVLRIACGAIFFPDIVGRLAGLAISPAIAGLYGASPTAAEASVCVIVVAEIVAAICLVLGLCTRYSALGAFVLMAAAVYSWQVVGVHDGAWNANLYKLPAFAGIITLCVAADAWRRAPPAPVIAKSVIPRQTGATTTRSF
jgi:putative oxidoreductase